MGSNLHNSSIINFNTFSKPITDGCCLQVFVLPHNVPHKKPNKFLNKGVMEDLWTEPKPSPATYSIAYTITNHTTFIICLC